MRKLSFHDYMRYREGFVDDQFGGDDDGGDIDKLNHFMLLALADQDIRGSLYPILQQIAGQDETGEMQDLLKRIDINNLGLKAKKLLKSKHKHTDDDSDGPEDKSDHADMVKPAQADSGQGLNDYEQE